MLTPLSRQSLMEEVLDQIKQLVTSGKIKVGEQLPTEKQLEDMLGISRTTVRSALITLQAEGYIEIKRGKGAYVIDKEAFDQKKMVNWFQDNKYKIHEIIEARMALEPMGASLAAQRITMEQLEMLKQLIAEIEWNIRNNRINEVVKIDERFHEIIMQASGNELLMFMYSSFIPMVHEYRSRAFSPPANPVLVIDAHNAIVQALEKRDSEEAKNTMLNHIQASLKDIIGTVDLITKRKRKTKTK